MYENAQSISFPCHPLLRIRLKTSFYNGSSGIIYFPSREGSRSPGSLEQLIYSPSTFISYQIPEPQDIHPKSPSIQSGGTEHNSVPFQHIYPAHKSTKQQSEQPTKQQQSNTIPSSSGPCHTTKTECHLRFHHGWFI